MKPNNLKINMRRNALIAGILGVFWLTAPTVDAQQKTVPAEDPPANSPAYTSTKRVPGELLEKRPTQVLVLPSEPMDAGGDMSYQSAAAVGHVDAEKPRLPEGYVVAARQAVIEKASKWYVAHLKPVEGRPSAPPLRILPNRRLSMIEAILSASDRQPRFMITGRVTEFEGNNYILLENIAEIPEGAEYPARREKPAPRQAKPVERPDSTAPEPSAEEILAELMKQKPLKSVVLPENVQEVTMTTAPADKQSPETDAEQKKRGPRWPEETLLINRPGRLVPGESGWLLTFEDQGANPSDQPIRLLPNRLLESAVAASAGGTRGVVFIVSGEVTVHDRTNYLLLRKVLTRRDLGNFH
jgi:hypothetical protein